MLVGELIGTTMGCFISPLTFMLFYKAFDIGNPDGYWKAHTLLTNVVRDALPPRYKKYVPFPTAMAVPFLVGASFAIDMCAGSLVVFVWNKMNKKEAAFMVPAVASGLMCGDGIWTFPSSLLALAKIKPPICMKFTLEARGYIGCFMDRELET
ncbi:hypothetical protein GUJ93_ZPchr0006g43413 [Zizania palustris]|uniref:Uncharacterized protein n=1 Tax=Zizania palustris TaxID=103762 RepID=A0A8J5SUA4_ZIZPA|nr:hypothetical protein GUJ93_ZPchr0006g43413 [Zizania palustris]